jgi:hypothetical protein
VLSILLNIVFVLSCGKDAYNTCFEIWMNAKCMCSTFPRMLNACVGDETGKMHAGK